MKNLVIIATIVSIAVLNAKCEVACKYEGFDDGRFFSKAKCICLMYLDAALLFNKKAFPVLPRKAPKSDEDY
jgi:hypothetical protein